MSYSKNGRYEYTRVAKAFLSEEKKDEEACVSSLNQFVMKLLEEEHERKKREVESDCYSQGVYLSDIICPKIFKISYGKHSRGFAQKANTSPYSQ
ncbi:hypothetical protein BD560DRAFT_176668 [Blakeslea trispora]|nr:hypothetical protein BD560DRAFT_176668 [Blakeslea trispora]